MNFQGGPKEAIKLLQLLTPEEQKRLLNDIKKKDPEMAQYLQKNLYTLEDLINLSTKDIQFFLNKIDFNDLCMALKIHSQELMDHFVSNLSKGRVSDLLEIINERKVPKSEAHASTQKIIDVMLDLSSKGLISLIKNDSDPFV